MSDEFFTTHRTEKSSEKIDMDTFYEIIEELNMIKKAEPYIFRFNDKITLQNLHHMIQDIITRYGLTTMYMKLLLKKEGLEELYEDFPEYDKSEIKDYDDIKSIFNIPIYENKYIPDKCIIIYAPPDYNPLNFEDFINSIPNIGKI